MKDFLICILAIMCTCIGFLTCFPNVKQAKIEGAMEVYRGNTKLQYTVVDSVKVDSCVIFLNK